MRKIGKINSIRVVRFILDYFLYIGGTFTFISLFSIIGNVLFIRPMYSSASSWPVTMNIVGEKTPGMLGVSNSLALTEIDPSKWLDYQFVARVMPTRAYLILMSQRNVILMLFDFAWVLLLNGTVLLIVSIMRIIFRRMESDEFFDPKTPMHLRLIGWTLIISSLLWSSLTYLYGWYTASLFKNIPALLRKTTANPQGQLLSLYTSPSIDVPYESLLVGLAVLVFAIAFPKGLALKQEQALTV